jgi:PP-loop superfamily ATP-utilizing enzyme
MDEREVIADYLRGLPTDRALDEAEIRKGYEAFKARRNADVLQGIAQAHGLDLEQFRVRVHGEGANALARIEVLPGDLEKITEEKTRQYIAAALKKEGFAYVSLDLAGYRTGSMNEVQRK